MVCNGTTATGALISIGGVRQRAKPFSLFRNYGQLRAPAVPHIHLKLTVQITGPHESNHTHFITKMVSGDQLTMVLKIRKAVSVARTTVRRTKTLVHFSVCLLDLYVHKLAKNCMSGIFACSLAPQSSPNSPSERIF